MTETMTSPSRIQPVGREYYRGPEIEVMFSVTRYILRSWRRQGLKSYGAGKRLRYKLEDVLEFLETMKQEGQG